RVLDVLRPALMLVDGIDRQSDDLDTALVELGFDLGHIAQLGRADGRKVFRVREEHGPALANPLVKTNLSFRRFGFEIGRDVVDSKAHTSPPSFGNGKDKKSIALSQWRSRSASGRWRQRQPISNERRPPRTKSNAIPPSSPSVCRGLDA